MNYDRRKRASSKIDLPVKIDGFKPYVPSDSIVLQRDSSGRVISAKMDVIRSGKRSVRYPIPFDSIQIRTYEVTKRKARLLNVQYSGKVDWAAKVLFEQVFMTRKIDNEIEKALLKIFMGLS